MLAKYPDLTSFFEILNEIKIKFQIFYEKMDKFRNCK